MRRGKKTRKTVKIRYTVKIIERNKWPVREKKSKKNKKISSTKDKTIQGKLKKHATYYLWSNAGKQRKKEGNWEEFYRKIKTNKTRERLGKIFNI